MSTRASICYDNNGLHIYEELLDGYVYLEMDKGDISINVKLMKKSAWMDLGFLNKYPDSPKEGEE